MTTPASHRRRRSIAFTLLELLIVVAIIAVMAAAGVPAIRNIIYSSTSSLAESQLRLALNAARDLAIRNPTGDTAAVFTYESGGRLTIIPAIHVGTLLDGQDPGLPYTTTTSNPKVYRDVFVPTPMVDPVQLPQGWMVRGFAPPGSIYNNSPAVPDINGDPVVQNGWYYENFTAPVVGNRNINLDSDPLINGQSRGTWVFPENAFFDETKREQGDYRQTFMVRFQRGTGRVLGSTFIPSVLLLPRSRIDSNTYPTALADVTPPIGPNDWRRVDRIEDLVGWARSVLALNPAQAAALIGARSTDSVTVNSVGILGLYEETRMAAALGASGVNRITGTIYGTTPTERPNVGSANEAPKAPNIDVKLWGVGTIVEGLGQDFDKSKRAQDLINSFMIGALKARDIHRNLNFTDGNRPIDADVRLFVMDTYLGNPKEVKP
jgi:prepilin-type N-terminal cleavage/methylation domain-containing protein